MIEIMYSDQIQISNLTLINSPSWFVHPIYSRFDESPSLNFSTLFKALFSICVHYFIVLIILYIFSNIIINGLTILAPVDVPNTDGIDPGNGFMVHLTFNHL